MKRILLASLIFGALMLTHSVSPMETKTINMKELLCGGAIGAAAGCGEVIVNQPLIVLKNMLQLPQEQRNMAFAALSKKTLIPTFYRGLSTNLAGMGPATAFQIGVAAALNGLIAGEDVQAQFLRASCAGISSAFVATPIERVIVMQQVMRSSPATAIKAIAASGGFASFNKAFMLTAAREGVWTPAYQAIFPALEKQLKDASGSHAVGLFGAATATAALMVMITQPFDTVKTVLQSDCKGAFKGIKDAVVAICNEIDEKTKKPGGLKNLWKGAVPRATRASLAIPFLKYASDYLKSKMDDMKLTQTKE